MRTYPLTILLALVLIFHGCARSAQVTNAVPGLDRVAKVARATREPSCDAQVPARLPEHVFIIVLENEDYDSTFGSDSTSHLKTLAADGVLLTNYYGVGHNSLGNYIAMVSGQSPTRQTRLDCHAFQGLLSKAERAVSKHREAKARLHEVWGRPGRDVLASDGDQRRPDEECLYHKEVLTIADQLAQRTPPLRWAAYMEDMPENCSRRDASKGGKPRYAARHNPFAYFHSLDGSCAEHDKPLGDPSGPGAVLARDLQDDNVASLVFISPNLCHDGHNDCSKPARGAAAKVEQMNEFLRQWVQIIRDSKAYQNGMIIITFDEAEVSFKADWDTNAKASVACCNQPAGPFAKRPGIFGAGGGKVGAVILSPFVAPGTENRNDFNHYSLLRSIEDLFAVGHLGFAKEDGLKTFQECGVFLPDERVAADGKH